MAWPPRPGESQQRSTRTRRGVPRPSASHTSRNFGKRSGKSVRISAATSPRRPRGRRILASVTPVNSSEDSLFEDFKRQALPNFHTGGAEDRADGFRCPPLPSDDFAQIFGMHAQFKNGYLLPIHRSYLNLFGMIDQCLRNRFHKVLHGALHHSHSRVRFEFSLVQVPRARGTFLEPPRGGSSDLLGRQKTAHGIAGLRTARQPVLHALGVQLNQRWILERVVGPDDLDRPAIAGFALVEHDNAVKRLLLLANSSQADCQHVSLPPGPRL